MITEKLLRELYETQEKTMKEVSEELGVSVGTVFNYIKRYGIKSRPKMTDKTRGRISKTKTGKPSPLKGRKVPSETRRKISVAKKGKYKCNTKYGGHKKKRADGYASVYTPNHPFASKDGYVMEHILMMEEHIGRLIGRDEVVHHKNGVRDDNRIENLELMTFKEHAKYHLQERIRQGTQNYKTRKVRNKTTGETFPSIAKAGEKYNVSPSAIGRVCRGEQLTCRGCEWEYEE